MIIHAFVFFTDTNRWYRRFLKKGFGHCYAMILDEELNWHVIEPFVNYGKISNGKHTRLIYSHFVKIKVKTTCRVKFFLPTCAGIIKYFLGVKGWYIFTPYQLWRKLLRLKESSHGISGE